MQRKIIGLVSFLIVLVLVFAACGTKTTTTTATTTTSTSTSFQPIELIFNHNNPPVTAPAKAAAAWTAEIEKLSGGRVKFNIVWAGALLNSAEAFNGTKTGIADVSFYRMYAADGFKLNEFIALPFMGWPSTPAFIEIYEKLLDKYPELRAEWQGLKVFGYWDSEPVSFNTTKKLIRTPDDLVGMKLSGEGITAETLLALGAAPVQLGPQDMYTSLDKGLIEGGVSAFGPAQAFGHFDLFKYHTLIPGGLSRSLFAILMNPDSWNRLPADIQQIFIDTEYILKDVFYENAVAEEEMGMEIILEQGRGLHTLTDSELQQFQEKTKDVVDKWIADCEAKGLPGEAVYNDALKLIAEYK